MNAAPRLILIVAGAGVVGMLLWTAANGLYFRRHRELVTAISQRERILESWASERRELRSMREQLDDWADRTLGDTREVVEAALRARLNAIGDEIGLESTTVTTGRHVFVPSPARRSINRNNPLRNTPDFAELEGSITGEGTLEQVMRLLHRIEAEPWLKRIDSYTLDPRNDGGPEARSTRFKVAVGLTTLYLPGLAPRNADVVEPYDESSFAQFAALVRTDPFSVPAPGTEPGAPPATGGFDYGQWAMTMVTQTSRGIEVWILNRATGESRTLVAGDSIEEMQLVSASSDAAEFLIGDSRFQIAVGETLAERSPLDHIDGGS